ncbi:MULTISPECIES: RNA-guided endonuclease InsQ/TnpB family protein [unclassified Candidatus Frackibacter]|uniref:RNA-guided endonuclease InsQ/TnpB family protein n=1 Tax=unclassified Candidatus Frackibacter TaxID=2648818 RepID=UPI00088197BF|nr:MULTISPECIES: RNA-guided endonuclease TnpB family protein [unclassified Candidatus Frackibacter]SDC66829.1 transposase, IS605 OrfB family, central region [Candidatus Frackibacter sp. WG11]SEM80062.1 transposase, IS605 OrfB family, central region [Candidatus Frackibacter sp. WG12]SFL90645.1 transposase, IS605 OrfB family, central region [Candidatus Frackibacter sp. WG13]
MRLAFKFKPKFTNKQLKIIKEISWHTTKLYNIVNYEVRNNEDVKPVYTRLEKQFKSNWHNDFLHSHNRQQALKQLAQDWKSYFASIKDYNKNSNKYKGQPRPPKFKNMDKNPNEIIFTNLATRVRDNHLLLSLSKAIKSEYNVKSLKFELPLAVQSIVDLDAIQQVRIKQDKLSKEWYLLIIYKVEEVEENTNPNIMSIDLGLDNLATLTFKDNSESYIINGKTIKSKNSYFNKEIAKFQNIRMKQVGSDKFKDTQQIRNLRLKRRNYVKDYLHKASRKIIELAIENKVSTIIIGDLKNIKQDNSLKSFVQIPIQRLVELIEYKAELEGIKVILINESYTSGCSSVDLEKLNKANYDKSRRIARGLFKTGNKLINADVNGSLNIMRKYLKDKCIPKMLKQIRDNGVVDTPKRIRVA